MMVKIFDIAIYLIISISVIATAYDLSFISELP